MLSDSERLYILIVQYGLARDAEYENKIKRLQGLNCKYSLIYTSSVLRGACFLLRGFALWVQGVGAWCVVVVIPLMSESIIGREAPAELPCFCQPGCSAK